MISSSVRLARTRDGEEVRAALCRATGSEVPRGWDNAAVNALLEMADLPKDARDPLALKQRLAALQLPDLQLKQRKAVIAALEAQLKSARALELPERLHVDTPPPEEREDEAFFAAEEENVAPPGNRAPDARSMYVMPVSATGTPYRPKSNSPILYVRVDVPSAPFHSLSIPSTTRFVLVPMSVHVPPRMDANDSGIMTCSFGSRMFSAHR